MHKRIIRTLLAVMLVLSTVLAEFPAAAAAVKPTSVTMNETAVTVDLAYANLFQFSATVGPEGASQGIKWKTGNKNIAEVRSDGMIKAKKTGSCYIYAYAAANTKVYARAKLVVKDSRIPQSVEVSESAVTIDMAYGLYHQFSAVVHPDKAPQKVTWKTSNKKVAIVNSAGLVKAVKPGKCYINAYSKNNKRGAVKLTVVDSRIPKRVEIAETALLIDKSVTPSIQLTATVYPDPAPQKVTWKSSNTGVVKVNSAGVVVPVDIGKCYVYAYSTLKKVYARIPVTVVNPNRPNKVVVSPSKISIEPGFKYQLNAVATPDTASQVFNWKSSKAAVASVDQTGMMTAKKTGTCYIYAYSAESNKVYGRTAVTVKYLSTPKALKITGGISTIDKGDTMQLSAITNPSNASKVFGWTSSNKKVATVNSTGLVTGVGHGTAVITVYSKRNTSRKATFKVSVFDPLYPTSIMLVPEINLGPDGKTETVQLTGIIEPSTACTDVIWKSSDSAIASVDPTGLVTYNSPGIAVITCTSSYSGVSAVYNVKVLSDTRSLIIPERRTDVGAINENLQKIKDVRDSAVAEITSLYNDGYITASEANDRKNVIDRAFADYSFPWMTLAKQKYWKAANSEGGAKDFKTGIVYYGMPYISGSYANRKYNVEKALSEKRYTDSGSGYYLLNRSRLISGLYAGSDCSSFVSAAQWGVKNAHAADRTTDIYKSTLYKNVTNAAALRPGDILVRSGRHVVMFLYYVNNAKTQIMILEQGGTEPAINTVSCSIQNIGTYKNNSYIARRKKGYK